MNRFLFIVNIVGTLIAFLFLVLSPDPYWAFAFAVNLLAVFLWMQFLRDEL